MITMRNDGQRRLRAYEVNYEFFIGIIRKGWSSHGVMRCVEGLPHTAVFSHARIDEMSDRILLFFTDESFDPVPMGAKIPIGTVQYETEPIAEDVQKEVISWE